MFFYRHQISTGNAEFTVRKVFQITRFHLHRAAAIRQEIDFPPVGAPLGGGVVRGRVGEPRYGARCHILHPEGRHAAVLGHVVVGLRIEERLAVG